MEAGERVNLLGLPRVELEAFVASRLNAKPFRARQLMKWIYRRGAADFAAMTDLAQDFRAQLGEVARITVPEIVSEQVSNDGTRKWLLRMDAVQGIETVYIPEPDRGTLCISSQVGCAMDCSFCSTAQQGFNRNLSVAEIVGQVWLAHRELAESRPGHGNGRHGNGRHGDARANITNIVFMGMGEPLANFDNVVAAMQLMLDDDAYGLSRRRVTLSTSGLVPALDRLRDTCPVALAVSLHAPTDALRDELVPINKKYPLKELLAACVRYIEKAPRDFVTFEYVMLDEVNDTAAQARQLVKLVQSVPCKINLIPFNPFPHSGYQRSSADAIARFRDSLMQAGLIVTVRKTRGDDIDAACGQLAGQVQDKTRRRGPRLTAAAL